MVQDVTRVQFNSVSNTVEASCIDHVYTNTKYRCSHPSIIAFGDSDHDLIKYTRYSKIPQISVRVLFKRSYKKFNKNDFLRDLDQMDWTDVFLCWDVNNATETFTHKFKYILNKHAPWTRTQQRKNFAPWLTDDTKRMIKERDQCKSAAKELSKGSSVVCQAQSQLWAQYKKLRNKINNRRKREEILYKTEKMSEFGKSPDLLWKQAKHFMGWKTQGTPCQVRVNNAILKSAQKIAQSFNDFFASKVASIRSSMPPGNFPINKLKEIMSTKNCKMQLNHVSLAKVNKPKSPWQLR